MNEKLRNHVNILFVAVPKTPRAAEMKEELLVNLNEKYDDLLKSGYDSNAAFHIALSGIGDPDELFREFQTTSQPALVRSNNETVFMATPVALPERRRSAAPLFIGAAIALFVLGPGMVMLFTAFHAPILGIFCMFACEACAIGLITYLIVSMIVNRNATPNDRFSVVDTTPKSRTLTIVLFGSVWLGLMILGLLCVICTLGGWSFWYIIPTGPVITQERQIEPFTKLEATSGINVELHKLENAEENERLLVETHEDMMDNLITESKDGKLVIKLKHGRYTNVKKRNVQVYFKNLDEIRAHAAASISCGDKFVADSLDVESSSAARIDLKDIETKILNCEVSSASMANISGKVEDGKFSASSAAQINATGVSVAKCEIDASSASQIRLGEIEELSIEANSAATVSYKGSPNITKQKISSAAQLDSIP